jgi:predicted nucleic acid-binding protein
VAEERVICDSDVIIDYWNVKSYRYSQTQNILENLIGIENVILSGVSQMELLVGATNKSELARINKNLKQFNITLINDGVNLLAVELLQEYKLSHGLALPDAFIAATSLYTQFPLFTYNIKDYKFISGLKLYQPQNP